MAHRLENQSGNRSRSLPTDAVAKLRRPSGNAQFICRFERRATLAADYGAAVAAGERVGDFGGALRAVKYGRRISGLSSLF